jgi:transposase
MAGGSEGSASAQHAVRPSQLVELGWHSGSLASPLRRVPRTKRSGSKSSRRHHRQPKREKRGKGAWIDLPGYDAGKKIKGKKRHILVDTLGLLLHAIVHAADIQDRDGRIMLLSTMFGMHPSLKKPFADAAYQGPGFHNDLARVLPHLETEIVKCSDQVKGFAVLPKRCIVECTIVSLNRCRRLAKDWENFNRKDLAFLRLASIRLTLRKLCNPV